VTGPCHLEHVGAVPVLVNGELTAEDRAEVEDFAALLQELGEAQRAAGGVRPTRAEAAEIARRIRRVGRPCGQCTGYDRQHTDDCPEGVL
jgi:hypothetical protein